MSSETITQHFHCVDCCCYFDLRILAANKHLLCYKVHCPLCQQDLCEIEKETRAKVDERTRETETGPIRSLEVLWSCCRCHVVFDQYQMCPICKSEIGVPDEIGPPVGAVVKNAINSLGLHLVGFQFPIGVDNQMLTISPEYTVGATAKEWSNCRNFKLVFNVKSLTENEQLNLSELLSRVKDVQLVELRGK